MLLIWFAKQSMPVSGQLGIPLYWSASVPMEKPWSKATFLKRFAVPWQTKSSLHSLSHCSCSAPAIWNAFIAFLAAETLSQSWWLQSPGAACEELGRRRHPPGVQEDLWHHRVAACPEAQENFPVIPPYQVLCMEAVTGRKSRIGKLVVFLLSLSVTAVPWGGCRQSDLQHHWRS